MRRVLVLFVLAGLCVPDLATQQSPAGEKQEPKHLKDAKTLLDDLLPKNTSYRHKDADVQWKGANGAKAGICHTDCSGFVDALLTRSYDYGSADFKKWFGSARPTAKRYYEEIVKENGFKKIAKIQDLRPGDIIAIKYPPGDENTGHVMLAVSPAKAHAASKPKVD